MKILGLTLNSPAPELLKAAAAAGRPHHAYLFSGPEGSGKAACAVETALALLCRGGAEKPCRACASCRKILNYNHPDFRVVFPFLSEKGFEEAAKDLNLKAEFAEKGERQPTYKDLYQRYLARSAADLVRAPLKRLRMSEDFRDKNLEITKPQADEIIDAIGLPPSESPYKIFLIAEADQMNAEAANTLLKTLEEPPSYVIFFLISSRAEALLPTIRSRCQVLRFSPVSAEALKALLLENAPSQPEKAEWAARLADGSVREALDLMEDANVPLLQEAVSMIECAAQGDAALALKLAADFSEYAWTDNLRRLNFFVRFLRELRLFPPLPPGDKALADIGQRLDALRPRLSADFFTRGLDRARVAMDAIERKVQPRLAFSAFLLGLMDK